MKRSASAPYLSINSSGSNPGKDQALAEDWIAGSRNFATKLWNATRFAMMNGATIEGPLPSTDSLSDIDKWVRFAFLANGLAEPVQWHRCVLDLQVKYVSFTLTLQVVR